jgi:OmpA-OmpF porin, OOP family
MNVLHPSSTPSQTLRTSAILSALVMACISASSSAQTAQNPQNIQYQGPSYLDPAYNRYKEPSPAGDPAANEGFYNGSARNSAYWTRQDVRALPTPQAGRITDSSIHQDYLSYEAQQARINASRAANNPYATGKAQCWLDVSFQEYTRNDRSSFVEESFLESTKITDALGGKTNDQPWTRSPLVNQATNKPAPISALWERWKRLSESNRNCKPLQSACGEVELIHAGNEWNQGGFVHAKPYIMLADRYISQAELNDCAPPPVAYVPPPVAPPPPPVVVVAPKLIPTPLPVLAQRVHFEFDQSYIAPSTAKVLDTMAAVLKANPSLRLSAIGHTDIRANDVYNLGLSMRRVSAVQEYLRAAGILPGQLQLGSLAGLSVNNPIATEVGKKGKANAPIVMMAGAAGKTVLDKLGNVEESHQYNRRVEFALATGSVPATLNPQYLDLHPCGSVNAYWCDHPKRKSGEKPPRQVQDKMNADKAQVEAQMRRLQSVK